MTFRYYLDQLAKMEPAKRQQLETCASVRTEKWIDVPSECLEPAPTPQVTAIAKAADGASKPSASYRAAEPTPSLTGGPGDLVKIVLDKLGIKPKSNCGCETMRRRMNEWGYRGCWAHRHEIRGWFESKATEAGIDVGALNITRLVADALRRRTRM